MTCRYNLKVTVYPVYICAETRLFSPLHIIILTARRKANNYVTRKTISPPCLAHLSVSCTPSLAFNTSSPYFGPFKCLPDGGENSIFISCDFPQQEKSRTVQGYPKVLVLLISLGYRRARRGRGRKMVGRKRGKERHGRYWDTS